MTNKLAIRLFLCLALAQLVIPASMIIKRENVLKHGTQFKFKVAPVDPYDAFRGRYVAIGIENSFVPVEKRTDLKRGQTAYAQIQVDEQGFAKFSGITLNRPPDQAYMQVSVANTYFDKKIGLDTPIKRYYMEESAAPKAEKIYRQTMRRENKDAYVLVRVKDGLTVVESLYVGGQRIEAAVKKGL